MTAARAGRRGGSPTVGAVIDHVEVSREIKAPAEEVWAAIADVTRMGEWSPECHTCAWNDPSAAPGVGSMFTGENRNGDFEWATECEVTEWVPGRAFAFDGCSATCASPSGPTASSPPKTGAS